MLLPLLALSLALAEENPDIVFEHVNVIPCDGGSVIKDTSLLVHEGRIREIGGKEPVLPDTVHVDGTGKYLIPGLWDMHVHGTSAPGFTNAYIANGVLGVRDMFDPTGLTIKLRDAIKSGATLGPHIVAAGKIVDGPKPIWPGSVAVTTPEDGTKAVGTVLGEGSDFVKVYSLLPHDAYVAIAAEAKKRGATFAGHVPESVSIWEASTLGQKSMEHLYGILRGTSKMEEESNRVNSLALKPGESAKFYKDLIHNYDKAKAAKLFSQFKKNENWQCPTLTVLNAIRHPHDKHPEWAYRFDYLPSWMRTMWANFDQNPKIKAMSKDDEAAAAALYKRELQLVGDMYRAGVPLLVGTDVMNPYCFPGFSVHDELANFVSAGVKPADALRFATQNAATYLGLQKAYGTVAKGKVADLVLLDADPTKDIHNTTKISGVMIGGQYFDRQKLDTLMPRSTKNPTPPSKPNGGMPFNWWVEDDID